jgi:hypothetical protein
VAGFYSATQQHRAAAPLAGFLTAAHSLSGSSRCRLHGGLSTGPKTLEGKLRSLAAAYEGKKQWFARMRAEGRPLPGRPKGSRNRSTIAREEHNQLQSELQRDHEAQASEQARLRDRAITRAIRQAKFTPQEQFILRVYAEDPASLRPDQLFIKRTRIDPKVRHIEEIAAAYTPLALFELQPFSWPARSPASRLQGPFRPAGLLPPPKSLQPSMPLRWSPQAGKFLDPATTHPSWFKPVEKSADTAAVYEARMHEHEEPVASEPQYYSSRADADRRYKR